MNIEKIVHQNPIINTPFISNVDKSLDPKVSKNVQYEKKK